MEDTNPPANVTELKAKVTATIKRLQAHRDAMAQVAVASGKTTTTSSTGGEQS